MVIRTETGATSNPTTRTRPPGRTTAWSRSRATFPRTLCLHDQRDRPLCWVAPRKQPTRDRQIDDLSEPLLPREARTHKVDSEATPWSRPGAFPRAHAHAREARQVGGLSHPPRDGNGDGTWCRASELTHPPRSSRAPGAWIACVKRILMKLHLRDRVQAVIFAYESGLTQPGPKTPA
jgi:hypothetical protein